MLCLIFSHLVLQVIAQLRAMEKDIMGRLTAVSDSVEKAKSQAALGSIAVTLNNAETPLLNIVRYWNNLYPEGNTSKGKLNSKAAQTFKDSIGNNIAKVSERVCVCACVRV